MAMVPADGVMAGGLFGDAEIAALFSDAAEIRAMLDVEAALARAEGRLGVIPAAEAETIAAVTADLVIDPADLAAGMNAAGMPVPALVTALKAAVPESAGPYVHWGATSQDIIDTGLVLRLARVADVLDARLAGLIAVWADRAARYRDLPMAARTRFQIAAPTTLGAKIAVWTMPLLRHRARLAELRPRLLVLSLHGAAGTSAAYGPEAGALRRALAADLGLEVSGVPWHAARDGIAEFGAWLSLVTGSLGKIAQDLILLGQSEIGELRAGVGGGSSTLPQKSNPVLAETLLALARANAGAVGALHQAVIHAQDRDGAAWSLEWLTLPGMCVASGAALRHSATLADTFEADAERIAMTFAVDRGLMLAEAAVFRLAEDMPRSSAKTLVSEAVAAARTSGTTLAEELDARTQTGIDWAAELAPERHTGGAGAVVDALQAAIDAG